MVHAGNNRKSDWMIVVGVGTIESKHSNGG